MVHFVLTLFSLFYSEDLHIYWFFFPGNILGILSYETNTKKLLGAVEWNLGKSWGHWIFLVGGKKNSILSSILKVQRFEHWFFSRNQVLEKKQQHLTCLLLLFSHQVTLCDPMDFSMPVFSVLHCLLELAQVHVHWIGDAFQPSYPHPGPF